MLGETTGTSAGGKDEEGKFLRVPGHEPVLPDAPRPPGQPLPRAARANPIDVYLHEHRPRRRAGGATSARKKVRIPHSSAIVEGRSPRARSSGRPTPTSATRSPRTCPASTRRTSTSCSRGGCTRRGPRPTSTRERVAQLKAERAEFLAAVPEPVARDRGFGRVAERLADHVRDQGRGAADRPWVRERRQRARSGRVQRDHFSAEFAERDNELRPLLAPPTAAELIGTVATRTLLPAAPRRRRHPRGRAPVARPRRHVAGPRRPRVLAARRRVTAATIGEGPRE